MSLQKVVHTCCRLVGYPVRLFLSPLGLSCCADYLQIDHEDPLQTKKYKTH